MNAKRLALLLTFVLASCGGGSSSAPVGSSLPPGGGPGTPAATQRVAFSLIVPQKAAGSSSLKRPAFISASALSALITVTQGSTTVTATLDLSPTSASCSGSGTSRTCTIDVTVPVGPDTITITIYNQAPVNGTIPPGAQVLGVGISQVDVVAGSTTSVPVVVGGQVASFGATLPSGSVAADGSKHTFAIAIAPTDFGDNAITTSSNAPYANPITVAIAENGGSGHALVSLNGAPPQQQVKVTQSTDSVSVVYDGGGSPGYSFTISLSASGVSSQTATIAPLIAGVGTSGVRFLTLFGAASNVTLAIGEAGSSSTYTPSLVGTCTGITTIGALSGSGAAATLPVQGGATASASGCSLSISDNLSTTLVLPISNTLIANAATVNGSTITEIAGYENPYGITIGPDGNIWFTDQGDDELYGITATGTPVAAPYSFGSSSGLYDLTTGSDGALWVTNENLEGLDRFFINGGNPIVSNFPEVNGGSPQAIIASSDGTLWLGDTSNGLLNVNVGGGFNQVVNSSISEVDSVAQAPDGSLWMADTGNNQVEQYIPSTGVVNAVQDPNGLPPVAVTIGPDGAIWFTAYGSFGEGYLGDVDRVDTSSGPPYTAVAITSNINSQPHGITAGADQAVWYADLGTSAIGRISVAPGNTASSYPLPSGNSPFEITLAPDGSLWFTENGYGEIGHIVP